MKVHPLFGTGIAGKSLVVTAQRRLNCYFENRSDKDRTPIACYGTPGMKPAFTVGSVALPVRGMAAGIYVWYVIGNQFLQTHLDGSGSFTAATALSSNSGYVSFSQNPTQVMLVDGVAGYIYVPTTGVLTKITDTNFNALAAAPTTVTNCQGYFVVNVPGTQQFNVSNFYDGTTYQALAFANATGYPDVLVAVDNLIGNLILFASTHLEFWQIVSGQTPQPFAPIQSATTEWGLAAVAGRVHANNCLYFLAASPQGGYSICEISGYQVNVISTPDLDYILGTYSTVADCTALAYRADQHPMVQFNFNTAGASWEFDCLTRLWQQKQSGVPTNKASLRHIGNYSVLAGGQLYISDYATNSIYTPDPATFTDNGATIVRQLVTRHQDKDFNVFSVDEMFCDFETGVGLSGTGQGSNPQVEITCSKDDGRTYLTPLLFPLGALGQYLTRVETRRWGSARRFTWSIKMTDPVKFAITSGAQSERLRAQ